MQRISKKVISIFFSFFLLSTILGSKVQKKIWKNTFKKSATYKTKIYPETLSLHLNNSWDFKIILGLVSSNQV